MTVDAGPKAGWTRQILTPYYDGLTPTSYRATGLTASITAGVLTIGGSGLGTKTTPAPLYFNDFESETLGNGVEDVGLSHDGGYWENCTVSDYAAYGGQSKALLMDYLLGAETFPKIYYPIVANTGDSSTGIQKIYTSFHFKWEILAAISDDPDMQIKFNRAGTYPVYTGLPVFRDDAFPNTDGVIPRNLKALFDSSGTELGAYHVDPSSAGKNAGSWHFTEIALDIGTAGNTDGYYETWHDLISRGRYLNAPILLGGSTATIQWVLSIFNGVTNWGGSIRLLLNDWYIDNTEQRVEIGDSAGYSTCTIRKPQPPITWGSTEITCNANVPGLTPGTNYVYIIDANGDPLSEAGTPVTTT